VATRGVGARASRTGTPVELPSIPSPNLPNLLAVGASPELGIKSCSCTATMDIQCGHNQNPTSALLLEPCPSFPCPVSPSFSPFSIVRACGIRHQHPSSECLWMCNNPMGAKRVRGPVTPKGRKPPRKGHMSSQGQPDKGAQVHVVGQE
jgi:hypothetical protein